MESGSCTQTTRDVFRCWSISLLIVVITQMFCQIHQFGEGSGWQRIHPDVDWRHVWTSQTWVNVYFESMLVCGKWINYTIITRDGRVRKLLCFSWYFTFHIDRVLFVLQRTVNCNHAWNISKTTVAPSADDRQGIRLMNSHVKFQVCENDLILQFLSITYSCCGCGLSPKSVIVDFCHGCL